MYLVLMAESIIMLLATASARHRNFGQDTAALSVISPNILIRKAENV